MRKVVLVNDLTISDITYDHLYEEFKRYLKKDIQGFFYDTYTLVEVACPGCGKRKNKDIYSKMQMKFKECSNCSSIYVSPRPTPESLEKFYRESYSCRFWRKESLNLPQSKLANLHSPRVQWILEILDEFLPCKTLFLDVETKYPYLIQQIMLQKVFESIILLNPKVYELKGLLPDNVLIDKNLGEYEGKIGVITAFESLERMYDPGSFFKIASNSCKPGGLMFITTSSCSGFEYQVLGEESPNINPINRMNLFSLEALKNSIETYGFEIIELSTPGRLDVEIVHNVFKESDKCQIDSFWRYIFKARNEETRHNLQNFLQVNRLSSHVRIVARKK